MPRKFPKLLTHVPPIWKENVCDSTNRKEIFVRFAITISAVRTLQVTRLLWCLSLISRFFWNALKVSAHCVLIRLSVAYFFWKCITKFLIWNIKISYQNHNLLTDMTLMIQQSMAPPKKSGFYQNSKYLQNSLSVHQVSGVTEIEQQMFTMYFSYLLSRESWPFVETKLNRIVCRCRRESKLS